MKKIININLSGRVIPIEDSAYEMLQSYIESLRRYFSKEDGRDEIINDIESRIAELMNDKVKKGSSAITDADLEEIISSIGRPEDFDADDTDETTSQSSAQQQQYSYDESRKRKRLYRDTSDKLVGGVCSGLAAYLNTDPAIVRILFAIITFGGFGLGFLIYILLWIFLPTKSLEGYSGKRLYRNPDDRILGGVAGGLAAYFNRSPKTIRLIFAAPLILNIILSIFTGWDHGFDIFPNIFFGSLTSTFIVIYVILWIVLPEARSNYEKMEMRGEKVDLNSIRQNVQEGMGSVKDRMKDWSEEVKESAQNIGNKAKEFANTRGKTFAAEVGETARRRGTGIGQVIGFLFKVFFLFIAGTIAFAFFVALMAMIFGGAYWWPINNFLWTSNAQQMYAWGTVLFFIIVPIVALIVWVIRRIVGAKSRSGYLGWIFGVLWTIGWVSVVLFASSVSRDFSEYEGVKISDVSVNQVKQKMVVVVSAPAITYTGKYGWMNEGEDGWNLSSDSLQLSTVKFQVVKSLDSAYHVTTKGYSYGRTRGDALRRAQSLRYNIVSQDSVLDLANGYTVDRNSKFRLQQVEIIIEVPAGKKIRFDESVREKLNPANFTIRKSGRRNRIVGVRIDDDYSFHFRSNVDYEMGIDGNLKDPGGRVIDERNFDYRYEEEVHPFQRDSTEVERLRKQMEEKDRKIKELEQKQNGNKTTDIKPERLDEEEDVAGSSFASPIFSVASWF